MRAIWSDPIGWSHGFVRTGFRYRYAQGATIVLGAMCAALFYIPASRLGATSARPFDGVFLILLVSAIIPLLYLRCIRAYYEEMNRREAERAGVEK